MNASIIIRRTNIYFMLILLFLSANSLNAQSYTTQIPKNNKITTIHNWLVSKPMPNVFYPKGATKAQYGFSYDFLEIIGGEKSPVIVPEKNFKTPDGKENRFEPHAWETDYLDLTKLYGRPSDVSGYLYALLKSESGQEMYLHFGSNDGGKVWVNGQLVINFLSKNGRGAEPSQNIVKINLKQGKNTILLKIDQLGGGWGAYVQLYSLKQQKKYENKKAKMLNVSAKTATIINTKVICKEPNRYIGWPTVAKTKSGELLAVFSGNRDGHICPYGITQLIRSEDKGKTWTKPATINNSPLDDRDAAILETKQGTLLVSWFTSMAFDKESNYVQNPGWKRHREKLNGETIEKWLGNWTRRSTNGGKTWETPVKELVSAPHGPIELKDGRLLYVGTAFIKGEKKLAVEESTNDGKTWKLLSTIEIAKSDVLNPYSEPHVVELSDGKLIAMFRYSKSKKDSYLRQTESTDGGKTWTVTHKTPIWGYPPHLILLKNAWVLASYGVRKIPYGQRACISKDGGKTWDIKNEIILTIAGSGDLGYPASVQLADGSIITIYYQIDKTGEKTSLMQTHWKLKK